MNHYAAGRRTEWLVRDDLLDNGFEVFRSAGSKTRLDLIALRAGQAVLLQVKRTNALLPPAERAELIRLADILGHHVALPVVATKPARQPIQYRLLTGSGPKDWTTWHPRGDQQ